MGLKPDTWIERMAKERQMIEPFLAEQVAAGCISYGLSSYGYDLRLADEFQIFTNLATTVVDPKHFDTRALVEFRGPSCLIPPNSFVLARTIEYLRIPPNVLTLTIGKSTYARCGIIVNVTPLEPGWEGRPTLEISNTAPLPARLYAGEGIAQVIFFEGDEPPRRSYVEKGGKYQAQEGIAPPRV
jgi:dCTP deaminase